MRSLIYLVASTLDGFIAEESRQDPSGTVFELEGDHAEPLLREYPEMLPGHVRAALGLEQTPHRHFDTVLEGRGSYQLGLDAGIGNAYPHLRHLVFSRTITQTPDPSVEIVADDPVATVRQLKSEPGQDIWLCGGGTLAGALRDEIDEIHLKLNPVVLGRGAPLIDSPAGASQLERYHLASARTFGSGVALLVYRRRR